MEMEAEGDGARLTSILFDGMRIALFLRQRSMEAYLVPVWERVGLLTNLFGFPKSSRKSSRFEKKEEIEKAFWKTVYLSCLYGSE